MQQTKRGQAHVYNGIDLNDYRMVPPLSLSL